MRIHREKSISDGYFGGKRQELFGGNFRIIIVSEENGEGRRSSFIFFFQGLKILNDYLHSMCSYIRDVHKFLTRET